MRVLVARAHVPFARGGAEALADALVAALREAGHEAELVAIPFQWHPPTRILDHMLAAKLLDLRCAMGAPADRVVALSFPAYYSAAARKTLWLLHLHRAAYDLWDHAFGSLAAWPDGAAVRAAIMAADRREISAIAPRFTISRRVTERVRNFLALEAAPLYPPVPGAELYRCEADEPYLFFPSRISSLKRQILAVQAMKRAGAGIKLVLAGPTETSALADELMAAIAGAGGEERVTYLGNIGEEKKRELYARCRAVVYPPYDEDYGYVTLEAMHAAKPVITCTDSGGPLEFVVPEETGFVTTPDAEGLAAAIARIAERPGEARRLGTAGRARLDALGINWPDTIERLLA